MKIEKINERQIKFIITNSDLSERGMNVSEFIYGAEKTQELFREMLEQAMRECNFYVDNAPLIVEAIPMSLDSITIIVTKVTDSLDIENKLSNLLSHISEDFPKIKKKSTITSDVVTCDNMLIYSFDNLDDVVDLASRIHNEFFGISSLYKNNFKYFLILELDSRANDYIERAKYLSCILNEYGQKHISTELSKYYLVEHGELIIYGNALNVLVNYLS